MCDNWSPIETAPKGNQWKRPELLLWDGRRPRVGQWNEDEYAKKPRPFWSYKGSLGKTYDRSNQPTHWMPLPAPLYTHPAPASPDAEMVRPIVGIENRTAQEVFDIMSDRIRLRFSKHGGDR